MSDNTKIEWADATVNAINGCSVISPGCKHCYAMKLAGTRLRNHPTRQGLTDQTNAGPVWNGKTSLHQPALLQPLAWKRPRRIFWNAHGDTFHENVPDAWIDQMFAVCALTPQHTHMILTKRSARMREYMRAFVGGKRSVVEAGKGMAKPGKLADRLSEIGNAYPACSPMGPLPNVWLGVSVEDQRRADERIPDLLATPAAVRFLSCEPLLGLIDLTMLDATVGERGAAEPSGLILLDALTGVHRDAEESIEGIYGNPDPRIDWVIVGGESGPGARPMHPDWARSLRDQCDDAGVAFHFKQWGTWVTEDQSTEDIVLPGECTYFWGDADPPVFHVGKKPAGRLLDGAEHNGMPEVRHG